MDDLRTVMDPESELTGEEFCNLVGCEGYKELDEFADAFARAVWDVFAEVENELAEPAKKEVKEGPVFGVRLPKSN